MIKIVIGTCVALTAVVAFATRSAPSKGPGVGESEAIQVEPLTPPSASATPTAFLSTPRRVRATPEPKAAAESLPEEDLADPTVFRQKQRALLASELEHQARDEAWARQASTDIEESLAIHKDIKALEIDCRESMCRLELEFRDDPNSSPDIGAIARSIPWPMHAYFEVAPDESNAQLYVTREGRTLPVI